MAAQRLLSGVVALAAVALAGEGRAAAQATKPTVPLPRWVRGSVGTDASAAAGLKLVKVAETASLDRPFATAKEVGGAAVAVRNAFETNAHLLASRKRPPVALLTKYGTVLKTAVRVIDPATLAYDLANGNLSASEAGRNVTVIVATTVAAPIVAAGVTAGMMALPGLIGATASTGTAISTLSGAAYTSAAAAWYGGGAVAVGGCGVATGGVVVTAVTTAGVALVVAGVGYGVYKTWNIFDPAERDAMNKLAEGFQARGELVDTETGRGAALLAQKRQLDEITRRRR